MSKLNGFIEVTALIDGKKAIIRAACIDAVVDNAAETADYSGHKVMVKPPCTTIIYSGTSIDVMESLEDISNMIYQAEL